MTETPTVSFPQRRCFRTATCCYWKHNSCSHHIKWNPRVGTDFRREIIKSWTVWNTVPTQRASLNKDEEGEEKDRWRTAKTQTHTGRRESRRRSERSTSLKWFIFNLNVPRKTTQLHLCSAQFHSLLCTEQPELSLQCDKDPEIHIS